MVHKEEKLISVIMPALNADQFITEAIDSILNQSYKNIELIVIDDGSTDKTKEIVQSIKDPRVKLYVNKSNLGVAATRNRGIHLAKGSFIAWQDADDISVKDRLKNQLQYLETYDDVGIVGGFLEFFKETGVDSVRKYAELDMDIRKNIFKYSPLAQPASMIRSECFKSVGLYNEKLTVAEDLDMAFRIGVKYKFANVQKVVLKYRLSEGSLTHKKLAEMEKETIRIRQRFSKNCLYRPTATDYLYNILQYISIFIIPSKFKIRLFNILRNS